MIQMRHPELPVGAFLAAILVLIPVPWHWRARNIATLAIMFWLFTINIINGVNSIIWAGNAIIRVPVWCDITTKIYVGSSYALPAATMCICKHLELVASTRRVRVDHDDKRRRMIFESIMCFGIPAIFMALHYIVQGHRFDIVEDTGCTPAIYTSIASIMILLFPPLLLSTITFIYAGMALIHFIKRRISFSTHLQTSNSALTTTRYLRLIAMSVTEMVFGTFFNAYNIYSNVSLGLRPWTSWSDVHSNWGRIGQFPAIEIPASLREREFLFWWAVPVSSFIFFLFFGFGEEGRKEYRKLYQWIRVKVFRKPVKPAVRLADSYGSAPSYRRAIPTPHRPVIHVGGDVEKGVEVLIHVPSSVATISPKRESFVPSDDKPSFPSPSSSITAFSEFSSERGADYPFDSSTIALNVVPPSISPPVPAYHLPFNTPSVSP